MTSGLLDMPPFAVLPADQGARLLASLTHHTHPVGAEIYAPGVVLDGLHVVVTGTVEISDPGGALISRLGPGECFGERGLLRDGRAATRAVAIASTEIAILPAAEFARLMRDEPAFKAFFERSTPGLAVPSGTADLTTMRVGEIMTPDPVTIGPEERVDALARMMRDRDISCVLVTEDERLIGIVTDGDLVARVVAEGLGGETPVGQVMTPDPVTVDIDALGHDAFLALVGKRIGHFPVTRNGRVVGIATRTNLLRRQSLSAGLMITEIARCSSVAEIAAVTERIPQLLAQLVGSGARPDVTTRLITDIGDAATRRLLEFAEDALGPPPVAYLWLACGSQGRREQTGVSDQDNCLMIADAIGPEDDGYFAALAKSVSDGLDACGYFYCPGDMMATNPKWRQPVRVWRRYFRGWVETPDPMAQMLASVMFDLRPIHGQRSLFDGLQAETLEIAATNSIFVAHMVANSLKHQPPLNFLGRLSTGRSGARKGTVDLKHGGVVPVVDLARVYAILGLIRPVATRVRLTEARDAGVISAGGAHDLIDAYDLIATMRLEHQARQVRAGEKPDNFMTPRSLSDLERNHLRDAFVVVRTMQSALGQGRNVMT